MMTTFGAPRIPPSWHEIWVPFYFKMLKIRMYLEKLIIHGVLGWLILDKIPELWSLIKGRRVSSHTVWYPCAQPQVGTSTV